MIKVRYLLGIGVGLYSQFAIAIVNVDNLHFQGKKESISGSISLSGSASGGNTEKTSVAFNSQIQWNQSHQISLLVLGYDYGKSGEILDTNKSYIHFRHVRHATERLDYEFYAQAEENEFLRLNYRGLYGGGVRFLVGKTDSHLGFIGLGGFREEERIAEQSGFTDELVQDTGRWNFYLMSRYKGERIQLTNTLYWQPRMAHFPDRRALFVSILKVKATKSISMRMSLEVVHDGKPPQGVEETDQRFKTGLEYEF